MSKKQCQLCGANAVLEVHIGTKRKLPAKRFVVVKVCSKCAVTVTMEVHALDEYGDKSESKGSRKKLPEGVSERLPADNTQ
jgi:hypothetical protein